MDLTKFDGHTPGPWAVHGNDVVADDGSVVADVAGGYWWRGKRPPFAANARLMAASPDLLDEVRRLTAEADALRRERDELAGARESVTSGELFTGDDLAVRDGASTNPPRPLYPFNVPLGEAIHKLKAELAQAREVLADCAETLEGYARHHAERGPGHAHKVVRNAELAARCRAALAAKGE